MTDLSTGERRAAFQQMARKRPQLVELLESKRAAHFPSQTAALCLSVFCIVEENSGLHLRVIL